MISGGLKATNKEEISLAKITVQCGLQALNLGYGGASDIIPRMIDVVGKYRDGVATEFAEYSKKTPAWFFLRWISQIASILNRPESSIISNIVAQIAQKYPQSIYYPYKVIESNLKRSFAD